MRLFLLIFASGLTAFCQNRDVEFDHLAGRLFDEVVFRYDPASATQAGFHGFDSLLPSMSRTEIESAISDWRKFEVLVENFAPDGLSPWVAADRELALSQIRSQMLSLETIRPWEKNPDIYSSGVTSAVFVVISRAFAPPEDRLKSVIARERLI